MFTQLFKRFWRVVLLLFVLGGLLQINVMPVQAVKPPVVLPTAKEDCENALLGTWMGASPNEIGGECHVVDPKFCAANEVNVYEFQGFKPTKLDWKKRGCMPIGVTTTPESAPPTTMKREGVCKLIDVEVAYLGGTISATLKGAPAFLTLKANGKVYKLPVVPGSVVANGDGTYTAQFYTLDPLTGQALVPAGDYTARCHGTNGSNDGGSANTVSIGY